MLVFVTEVIEELNIGENAVHVGLVVYSEFARHEFFLSDSFDKSTIQEAVLDSTYLGSFTNTSGGLRIMQNEQFSTQNGARVGVKKICIVITDGESNKDQDRTISDSLTAQAQGIEIISIGVTDAVNIEEVKSISS